MSQKIAAAILGAGSVRFDLYNPDTQTWGGLGDKLETDKFAITPDSDKKEKTSKSREAYGQSIAAVVIAKPTKISIVVGAVSQEVMAMQFQGVIREDSQGASSIVETIPAKLDKWAKLSKRNVVEASFAVKNAAGLVTYVKGTDYLVDYATGEIKPLAAGAIAADEVLHVTGTALAVSTTVIRGGVRAQVRVRAVWQGVNLVDGREIECEAWEAMLTANNGFDFLASDFNGFELEGTLVVPPGKTESFEVRFTN